MDKSNVIVFRNSGHIASYEHRVYGEHVMRVVNVNKRLGIDLSTPLTFSHALTDAARRAKKGVVGIFKLWEKDFLQFSLSCLIPRSSQRVECSSVGRASDQHAADASSIPRCDKGFFSQSQLSVQTLVRCPYTPVYNGGMH